MAELPSGTALPIPETDDLGRYLEDTITIVGKVMSIEGGVLTAQLSAKNQKGDDVLKNTVVEARI